MLAAFVVTEARRRQPMVSPRLFRDRAFTTANLVVLLAGFALLGFVFFNTLYFQAVQGWSPLQAGLRSLPSTLAVVVSAPVAGRLASRYGYRVPVVAGLLLAAAALWALAGIEVGTPYAQLWWKLAMLGAGLGLSISPATAAGVAAMPGTQAGVASAVITTSRQVGGALGVAVLGAVAAARYGRATPASDPVAFLAGVHAAYLLAAAALAVGAVAAMLFLRPRRAAPDQADPHAAGGGRLSLRRPGRPSRCRCRASQRRQACPRRGRLPARAGGGAGRASTTPEAPGRPRVPDRQAPDHAGAGLASMVPTWAGPAGRPTASAPAAAPGGQQDDGCAPADGQAPLAPSRSDAGAPRDDLVGGRCRVGVDPARGGGRRRSLVLAQRLPWRVTASTVAPRQVAWTVLGDQADWCWSGRPLAGRGSDGRAVPLVHVVLVGVRPGSRLVAGERPLGVGPRRQVDGRLGGSSDTCRTRPRPPSRAASR